MTSTTAISASQFLAEAKEIKDKQHYRLTLYVAGTTPHSARAIVNVREICEEFLIGRYMLQVVDITRDAKEAIAKQVVAVPLLLRELPLPERRFVGDMSDRPRLLAGLDLIA
jgi:circadian clock protein KaiB